MKNLSQSVWPKSKKKEFAIDIKNLKKKCKNNNFYVLEKIKKDADAKWIRCQRVWPILCHTSALRIEIITQRDCGGWL